MIHIFFDAEAAQTAVTRWEKHGFICDTWTQDHPTAGSVTLVQVMHLTLMP